MALAETGRNHSQSRLRYADVAIDEYLPIVIRDAEIGMAPAPCQDWSAQSNCKLCAGR